MFKHRIVFVSLAAGLALIVLVLLTQGLVLAQGSHAPDLEEPSYTQWNLASASSFAFTRFDAEYSLSTGLVYVLGGRLADASTDGSIWQFDPATGIYTDTGVDMPVPISNYTIARLTDANGDEILMTFGGRPAAGGVVDTVQGYYPVSNTTVLFNNDPYPVFTSPGGVAVVDNIAYSFGGFDAAVVIADTYIFDILAPAGSRWTTGPSLGSARAYIGVGVVDGVIYAMGGDDFVAAALVPLTMTERLDTNAGPLAWDDAGVADMPIACDENQGFGFDTSSAYELAGMIVLAGCGQWPAEIAESLIYDVAGDTWDMAFPDLINARRNHAGAFIPTSAIGPAMWVWGGRQGADTNVLTAVEFYTVPTVINAGFSSNSPVALGETAVFTNSSGGAEPITYLWEFGDGMTSTLESPTHDYAAAGTYTVTLTASNADGTDSVSQAFVVYEPVAAGFTSDSPVLLGEPVNFTNTTAGTGPITYLWDFGDSVTSTLESPSHTYAASGVYTVTLTATGPYGSDIFMDTVEVIEEIEYVIGLPVVINN
jgi:PKD repeat protein